jgi:soluble lytic murein transglycosylase
LLLPAIVIATMIAGPTGATPGLDRQITDISAAKKSAARKNSKASANAASKAKPAPKGAPKSSAIPMPAVRPASNAALAPAVQSPSSGGFVPASLPPAAASASDSHSNAALLPRPATTTITTSPLDLAAVKRAIDRVRARKPSDARDIRKSIADPVAKKLVEWVILRSDNAGADFADFASFVAANPDWPSVVTLRRRAEAMMFQERPAPGTVLAYFGTGKPLSSKGRLALARAMLAQGDRKRGEALVRETWRSDGLSDDVEARVQSEFGEYLTRDDHKARMDRRLYEKDDIDAGLRMANKLGGHEPAIAKARIALLSRGGNKALLEAVPADARNDIGYKYARLQMLRRSNHLAEAVALMNSIPQLDDSHDLEEWWIERRLLARELLDEGDFKNAYLVARNATPPTRDNYRAEHQFTAGWIALRFLHDPKLAYEHFKLVGVGNENPISQARAAYWQGRAAEAMHRPQEARAHYQEAARYPTAYYGQIARAKAGLGELTLTPFPALSAEQRAKLARVDVVRAVEMLYAVEAKDLANIMLADLGDKSDDIRVMAMLSEIAAKYQDARGMLLLGKLALGRGHALEHAAFPTIGVPKFKVIGPEVEPAIVYSIVRQESWFNPRTVSSANALGLMQVTPAAGRYVASKFKVPFDQKRLLNDSTYNVQMGAAELGSVISDYRGSYIMAFAAYNAGRGRVKEWVSRFGDPRDPKVDPIDWVERIPFSETRNSVQRVRENVQVYRIRFGGSTRLLTEADLRRGAVAN